MSVSTVLDSQARIVSKIDIRVNPVILKLAHWHETEFEDFFRTFGRMKQAALVDPKVQNFCEVGERIKLVQHRQGVRAISKVFAMVSTLCRLLYCLSIHCTTLFYFRNYNRYQWHTRLLRQLLENPIKSLVVELVIDEPLITPAFHFENTVSLGVHVTIEAPPPRGGIN